MRGGGVMRGLFFVFSVIFESFLRCLCILVSFI